MNEEKILQAFSELLDEKLSQINGRLDSMEREIKGLKGEVGDLKVGMKGLKGEVGDLKVDMKGLKGEVGDLKVDMKGLKGEVGDLKVDMKGLKGEVGDLKVDTKGFKGEVKGLREEMNARFDRVDEQFASTHMATGDIVNKVGELLDDKLVKFAHELKWTKDATAQNSLDIAALKNRN